MDNLQLIKTILFSYACLFVSLQLQTAIHEAGHLIAGKLSGYQFVSYRIGSLLLIRQDGKLKLKKFSIPGTSGQCIMVPPESDAPEKVPAVLYHAGGGLANLLSVAFTFLSDISDSRYVLAFELIFVASAYAMALMNLFPLKVFVPNDGYNIMLILKNKEDRIAMYNLLRLRAYDDIRPSQQPEKYYAYSEKGEYSQVSKMLYGTRLLDSGAFAEAENLFRECAVNEKKAISYYRLESACEQLFCMIIRNADRKEMDELMTDELKKYIRKTGKSMVSRHRLLYAYKLLAENNPESAGKEYDEAVKMLKNCPAHGEEEMERRLLEHVSQLYEERLSADEQQMDI